MLQETVLVAQRLGQRRAPWYKHIMSWAVEAFNDGVPLWVFSWNEELAAFPESVRRKRFSFFAVFRIRVLPLL